MRTIAIAFLAIFFLAQPTSSDARTRFGTDERLIFIQKVDAKGPNGEGLYLARKYRRENFIFPYALIDEGYVFGIAGSLNYIELSEKKIKAMQIQKLLPDPLPDYSIHPLDFVMGHILWFVIAFSLAVIGIFALLKWRKAAKA